VCLVISCFAVYTFLPTLLKAMDLNSDSGADFLLNGFLVPGASIDIWLTIKLPRRVFLISAFAIFMLNMLTISKLVGVSPPEHGRISRVADCHILERGDLSHVI